MTPFNPHNLPLDRLNWEQFVHLIGKANAEVARFDGLIQSMPNPSLLLSPLTTQEAVLSSRIEGTQASLEEIYQFEAKPDKESKKYDDIQEVLNYRKAMYFAIKELNKIPFCLRLLKETHKILLSGVRGSNKDRGNFRKTQVFIGKPGANIKEATYIPPAPNNLDKYLSNLEQYFHYEEKDALVQLAIIHAQFEIIHPFLDGNGRMGRIILPLFLYNKGILSSPMLYLSAYFERNREEYYGNLLNISKNNDWESWITFFLKATIEQSKDNIKRAKAIHALYEEKKSKITDLTRSRFAIKALDFLFSNPIFNSSSFTKESKIPRASANRILDSLQKGRVIKIINKGSGNKPSEYVFPKLFNIIK